MKKFIEILRGFIVFINYAMVVCFMLAAGMSVYMLFTDGLKPLTLLFLVLFAALAFLFYRRVKNYGTHSTKEDRMLEEQEKQNDLLFISKKCPQCGKRLAVCEDSIEDAFPRINIADKNKKSKYYCPSCNEYFDTSGEFYKYIPEERTIPEAEGERFAFRKDYINKTIRTGIFTYGGSALACLLLVIGLISLAGKTGKQILWVGVTLFCLLLLVSVLGLNFQLKLFRSYSDAYFQLLPEGLFFFDGKSKQYYPWDEFRIVSEFPSDSGLSGAVFDTAQRAFVINSGLFRSEELICAVLDRIRDTAKIESSFFTKEREKEFSEECLS